MAKDEFSIFKQKQKEIYEKYANSTDPKTYEKLNKEWFEFIKNFKFASENLTSQKK